MVMLTQPYTAAHAIARLDFALIFSKKLEDGQRKSIAEALDGHLKAYGLHAAVSEEGGVSEDDDDDVVAFVRKGQDEQIAEEVHVHENYVHVVWSDYRGWVLSRDGALERLKPVIEMVEQGRLVLGGVGLAYRDVFITDDASQFSARSLFRSDGDLLPSFLMEKGAKWRHWTGWHESGTPTEKWRSFCMLGVDVGDRVQEDGQTIHVAEVVHRQRLSPTQEGEGIAVEDLSFLWNEAHKQNRFAMHRLIGDEMLELIGLKECQSEQSMQ